MAAIFTPGPNLVTVQITNPARDDFGGVRIWRSTVNGFTPDASSLVYEGMDLLVVLTDLPAGVPQYFKYATLSEIDPADYDVSAQSTATPTAPSVSAEFITPGNIRGSNVFAGSFATKGATLALAVAAAAATITLTNTADFPASGAAFVYSADPTRDRDWFNYTGKTASTLTGVNGIGNHIAGEVVVPLIGKAMVIDHNVGEMRFLSDRGDGVVEEIANIGQVSTAPSGTIIDDAVIAIGSYAPQFNMVPLHIRAGTTYGIYAHRLVPPSGNQPVGFFYAQGAGNGPALWAKIDSTNTTYAMYAQVDGTLGGTAIKAAANGTASNGIEGQVYNSSVSTFAVKGIGNRGYGVYASVTGNGVPLFIEPVVGAPTLSLAAGGVYVNTSGVFFGYDGASWRQFLRVSDTMYAANGTAALPGFAFANDNAVGMRLKAAGLAFSTAGVEAGFITAAQDWTFTNRIFVAAGSGANPTYSFTGDTGVGMYATSGALRFAVAGALALELTANGNLRHLKPPRYPFVLGNPATGTTVTALVDQYGYINTATATKAALTVKLPPTPADGQEFVFGTRGTITATTFQTSAAAAIAGAPATLPAGGAATFVYDSASALWYPIGIS